MDLPQLSDDQRAKWAQRLARKADRTDSGQALPLTVAALNVQEPVERLEALGKALAQEKVIVPINVEQHPDVDGEHHYIDPSSDDAPQMNCVETRFGMAVSVFSSVEALHAVSPQARPMRVDFRKVALAALVEASGRVVVNSATNNVVLPRPLVAALAQGDAWLPAWRDGELLDELRSICASHPHVPVQDLRILPEDDGLTVRVDVCFAPGNLGAGARGQVMTLIEALRGAPRLQAAAQRVVFVPRAAV